jgi:hypothetical protein
MPQTPRPTRIFSDAGTRRSHSVGFGGGHKTGHSATMLAVVQIASRHIRGAPGAPTPTPSAKVKVGPCKSVCGRVCICKPPQIPGWFWGGTFHHGNFCRVRRQTLRVTLAMEAGITDHVWSVEELVAA